MTRRFAPLAGLLLLAACGYFNAMYNAQRRFGDARNLERSGDRSGAARAYGEAIEHAASSYRGHPGSRWADDALELIGRSRFALGEYEASRAAFVALLESQHESGREATARTYIGAASAALGEHGAAIAQLDSALAADLPVEDAALARLWRARARFELGDPGGAWTDLDAAVAGAGTAAMDARLEAMTRGAAAGDTSRMRSAASRLFADPAAAGSSDSLAVLLELAAGHAGPGFARSLLEDIDRSRWPVPMRETHEIARVRFTAAAGDTSAAIADALRIAGHASIAGANRVRTMAARLELARSDSLPDLDGVRTMLLPAVGDPEARDLIHAIRGVDVLLARSTTGDALALFVAAEICRDQLMAPALASRLFLAYADAVPDATWAPKALLAAADLDPRYRPDVTGRFARARGNVYVDAVGGNADPDAYAAAEATLARTLSALRESALNEADARDVRVSSVVARLDSLVAIARADSARVRCGAFIDSLAIKGIRADSVRAACMRADTARLQAVLRIDTLMLLDSTRMRRRGVDTTYSGAR